MSTRAEPPRAQPPAARRRPWRRAGPFAWAVGLAGLLCCYGAAVPPPVGLRAQVAEAQVAEAQVPDAQVPDAQRLYAGEPLEYWQTRLGQLAPDGPAAQQAVPGLLAILRDSQLPGSVRRPFALRLGRIGAPARPAVPVLASLIDQRHTQAEEEYVWAARALGLLGPEAESAAPSLVGMLFDERLPPGYRLLAVEGLARIGAAHPDVLPALMRLLQYRGSGDVSAAQAATFRELAAEALNLIGPEADVAAPLLIRIVRSPGEAEGVRRKAIVALGSLKYRGQLALPALCEALEFDPSPAARDAAATALGRLGEPALPRVGAYLRHEDPDLRWRAAWALGQMVDSVPAAAGLLERALADPDPMVRATVCEELAKAPLAVRRSLEAARQRTLVQLLAEPERQLRMRAARELQAIERPEPATIQALTALSRQGPSAVRKLAGKLLDQLTSSP